MSPAERYSRQILFPGIGPAGQERLGRSALLIVGCGALGSHAAELLARAGVGRIRIVDRDFVEPSNLHRQSLFTEADAAASLPKAAAAARRLAGINSEVAVEPFVEHLDAGNIGRLLQGADLILDGTDNFETRLLLNDYALRERRPWIYAACVGAYGLTMNILPGETPCLRCLLRALPPPGTADTCDTAGIIPPAPALLAAVEAAEAMKILSGARDRASRDLLAVDLWANTVQRIALHREAVSQDCPACARGVYDHLEGGAGAQAEVLCGRNAVQIRPRRAGRPDLDLLERRLAPLGRVTRNPYLVRAEVEGLALAVYADGRAIVTGTGDPARARALYDRYVGT